MGRTGTDAQAITGYWSRKEPIMGNIGTILRSVEVLPLDGQNPQAHHEPVVDPKTENDTPQATK